eukprot:5505190-Amphidinium_carterae.1
MNSHLNWVVLSVCLWRDAICFSKLEQGICQLRPKRHRIPNWGASAWGKYVLQIRCLHEAQVGVMAFYYSGKNETWDDLCQAPFLGNFYEVSGLSLHERMRE